jgi:transcriptional regulator with XRE-family HTH domain
MDTTDFPELVPIIQSVLSQYKRERRLSELARDLGFSKNRLSEILCGKRKLTLYYILKFIGAEIITIDRVFRDINLDDLPGNKRILAKRLLLDQQIVESLDIEMQGLLKKAINQKRMTDVRTILKTILKK